MTTKQKLEKLREVKDEIDTYLNSGSCSSLEHYKAIQLLVDASLAMGECEDIMQCAAWLEDRD